VYSDLELLATNHRSGAESTFFSKSNGSFNQTVKLFVPITNSFEPELIE
jgi:hypothetical protein